MWEGAEGAEVIHAAQSTKTAKTKQKKGAIQILEPQNCKAGMLTIQAHIATQRCSP